MSKRERERAARRICHTGKDRLGDCERDRLRVWRGGSRLEAKSEWKPLEVQMVAAR